MRALSAAVCGLLLSGCSSLALLPSGARDGRSTSSGRGVARLGPGAAEAAGDHFIVHAYSAERAGRTLQLAETVFQNLRADAGLRDFSPREPYAVFLFEDEAELAEKSGLPSWARSGIVDGAIVAKDDPEAVPGALGHFVSHLVFREHLGTLDERTRWLDEGLAAFEERSASPRTAPAPLSRQEPSVSFREMTQLVPLDESRRGASPWYGQVAGVVGYMIDRGGRPGFADFVAALRSGMPLDDAVRAGFPGLWGGLSALERDWNENR